MLRYIAFFGIILFVAIEAAIIPGEDDCDLIFECESQDLRCIQQILRVMPHCGELLADQLEKRAPLMNNKRHNRVKDIFVKSYMNRIGK